MYPLTTPSIAADAGWPWLDVVAKMLALSARSTVVGTGYDADPATMVELAVEFVELVVL